MQLSPDRNGAGLDVDEAFADPAFAPLKAQGAGFAIVRPETRAVLWANAAAATHWEAADAEALASALFGPGGRGGWLDDVARGLVPGRGAGLARAGLDRGFRMRARTALVRAWTEADGTLLVAFGLPEARGGGGWRTPAWPDPASPPGTASPPRAEPAPEPAVGGAAPEPADAGSSLARRSQLAILRDRLNHALDGAPSLRLLWRTDAADVVTQIDAASFARLGSPVAFDRAALPDAVAAFDPDGGARLRAALATRSTWSGIVLEWPVAEALAVVPMVLSASPVFGPDRTFAGFRGFGVVDLGRLDLAPQRWRAGLVPAAVAPPEPASDPAPDATREAEAVPAPVASPGVPPMAAEPPVPFAVPPANVVHLRAFQALAGSRFAALPPPADLPAPEDVPAPDQPEPDEGPRPESPLSDDLAFLALGEALRARINAPLRAPEATGAPEALSAPPPEPQAASSGPAEELAPRPDARASLLDQLPVGLVATVDARPVFANAAAAARLGHATPADLLDAGAALPVAAGEAGPRDARGAAVPARRAAVSWHGNPATLWILEDGAAAPAPQPVADEAEGGAGELLDRVDDAVALLDANGHVRRLNRRGEGWFGASDAIGQSFTQLLAQESRATALALLGEVRHQRDGLGAPPLAREVLGRTGDAAPVPMLLTLGRLGASGFYATLRDVTALKRAESDRARSEREHLRDVGRLPGLLGKVSHEIRTPLNAILGFAEVMMDERFGPLGNPRYRDYLKDIHVSGTQVVTLIEDLLDLSRIEAGQLDLDVAAVDVNRIVGETVAQMQPEAHRERVIMRTSLGGRIPFALADERATRQIVRNLLSNAVKFNEPGGQVIVSTALSDTGTVLLRVRDTGVGMTDDEIAAALEPFGGVASSHAAKANGNGLGLPLTRALVGANGASMAIRSRPREGTLVEVAFTSAVPAEDARRPA